jgi:hypothetical protein
MNTEEEKAKLEEEKAKLEEEKAELKRDLVSQRKLLRTMEDNLGRQSYDFHTLEQELNACKKEIEIKGDTVKEMRYELERARQRKTPIGTIGRLIIMGNVISGAIGLIIILSVVIISMLSEGGGAAVPKVLENWGGIVIGFYFGTFMGLVKDYAAQAKELKSAD